jgi:hypothetical protein
MRQASSLRATAAAVGVALVISAFLAPVAAGANPTTAPRLAPLSMGSSSPASSLGVGKTLTAGKDLESANGHYKLDMLTDGDLVEYEGSKALWATSTSGTQVHATLESDGDLIVVSHSNAVLWQSGITGTKAAYELSLENNATLAVAFGKSVLWARISSLTSSSNSSDTLSEGHQINSPSDSYSLRMQTDGNLVEYRGSTDVWATGTTGSGNYLRLGADGNLAVYANGGAVLWQTNNEGFAGSPTFDVQNDGNLVLYGSAGAYWGGRTSSLADQSDNTLSAGQSIASPSGSYFLRMQTDGNLVEYAGSTAIWATGTSGSGEHLSLGSDGNLVVYSSGGSPLWQTSNEGSSGAMVLDVQNDGNLVLYGAGGAYWARTTSLSSFVGNTLSAGQQIFSGNNDYRLAMQTDGNLVEYGSSGAIWNTGTEGTGTTNRVTMQPDGNLVVYSSSGTALWCSGTGGHSGGFELDLQNDSNLVVYDGSGVLWARTISSGNACGSTPQSLAIAWAEGYNGQNFDDGYCLLFVTQAYAAAGISIGTVGNNDGAAQYWTENPKGYTEYPGNTSPPVGALVFWGADDVDGYSNPYGHVGIYLGNNTVISTASWGEPASYPYVHEWSFSGRTAAGYPYLGWLLP